MGHVIMAYVFSIQEVYFIIQNIFFHIFQNKNIIYILKIWWIKYITVFHFDFETWVILED